MSDIGASTGFNWLQDALSAPIIQEYASQYAAKSAPPPEPARPSGDIQFEVPVATGDTVSGIAKKFGVSQQEIAELNGLRDPNRIKAGSVLILPLTPK